MNSEVIKANIEVHSRMADSYDSNEPHFRPENQAKVKSILEKLRQSAPGGKLMDMGCGTGFIINLAHDLFDEIHGVDVTPAMLNKVDCSRGNITLHNTSSETLPVIDSSCDVVTAYSFIHHLETYTKTLEEAYRVLKPGGFLYIDLEPNKLFWEKMVELEQSENTNYSDIILKEIDSVLHVSTKVEQEFGIAPEVFKKAEFIKEFVGGIDPFSFEDDAKSIGFQTCQVRFEWFLGQGDVMHRQSFELASDIEAYMRRILPLSAHLFKYLQFILTK